MQRQILSVWLQLWDIRLLCRERNHIYLYMTLKIDYQIAKVYTQVSSYIPHTHRWYWMYMFSPSKYTGNSFSGESSIVLKGFYSCAVLLCACVVSINNNKHTTIASKISFGCVVSINNNKHTTIAWKNSGRICDPHRLKALTMGQAHARLPAQYRSLLIQSNNITYLERNINIWSNLVQKTSPLFISMAVSP